MIILGIDPGYDRVGIAVLEKPAKGKDSILFSECFQTSARDEIYARFEKIGNEVARLMDKYKPDAVALESLFMAKNQKTAMRVAEARGIMIYEAVKRNIPVREYAPIEIKMAITSDGTSDKSRMIKMVRLLVDIPEKKTHDDEYDAIAVALACSANLRSPLARVA